MGIVDVADPCYIICIFIPKLSASNSNTLTDILSNNTLNQKFISLILLETLKLLLGLISNLLCQIVHLLSIGSCIFHLILDYFLNFLLGFAWSEFVFELWSNLVSFFTFVRVLVFSLHFFNLLFFKF